MLLMIRLSRPNKQLSCEAMQLWSNGPVVRVSASLLGNGVVGSISDRIKEKTSVSIGICVNLPGVGDYHLDRARTS